MSLENDPEQGIWKHQCEHSGCEHMVIYDDEPWCYTHSPDSGSSVKGYSAYAKTIELNENGIPVDWEHHPHNV